jgi:hypothetical protein
LANQNVEDSTEVFSCTKGFFEKFVIVLISVTLSLFFIFSHKGKMSEEIKRIDEEAGFFLLFLFN